MRWALIIGGVVATIIVIVLVVGYSLPVKHVASRQVVLKQPPPIVWQTITDVAAIPQWRRDVKSVEVLDPGAHGPRWREVGGDGSISYETAESVPVERLVSRIADKNLPFGGTWTYELKPDAAGTHLTIREDGEVYNPVFRFVSRYVMGHHATIDKYISALEGRLDTGRAAAVPR
jgi:uncharacterized protein YndB with AHSA1/START domain